jgi:hypothetical protein
MAKTTLKLRPWTKEDVRTLKTLAREKTKDDCDRAQTQAERWSDLSKGESTRRYVGRRPKETGGVKGSWLW